jgi:fructose-bisphosphate aldolase class I
LNRQKYRELLFTTKDIEKYVSGIIMFDETARQSSEKEQSFIELIQNKGIVPGIKVD